MRKTYVIFITMCLAIFAVWYTLRDNSQIQQASDEPVSSTGDSLPDAQYEVLAKLRSRELQKKRLASILQHMKTTSERLSDNDADELSEVEQIAADNAHPRQGVWRQTWTGEAQDELWTRQMKLMITDEGRTLSGGKIGITDLSCRETICRMYLQFENKRDAELFTSSRNDSDFHYGFQLLNPDTDSGNSSLKDKKYHYEVLVERERPEDLPEGIQHKTPSSPEVFWENKGRT